MNLRQELYDAAAAVCAERGLRAEIRFRWSPAEDAFRFIPREDGSLILILNLRQPAARESREGRVPCAAYLAAQMRLTADVRARLPRSYSEGLAFLSRIGGLEAPGGFVCGRPVTAAVLTSRRRPRNLRTEDLRCTASASAADADCREVARMDGLPEIVYGRDRLPRCAALCAVRRAEPAFEERIRENYPLISALARSSDPSDGRAGPISAEALFRAYGESGNPFFGGLAVRMLAYGSGAEAERILRAEGVRDAAAECARTYAEACRDYALETAGGSENVRSAAGLSALTDNRIAADRTMRRLNGIFGGTVPGAEGGSVYPYRAWAER